MTRRLLLGTRNKKKRLEVEELLRLPALQLITVDAYPEAPEVEETGTTFAENAALKACTLARALGAWVLGEDSGLCVDALGGAPGIYSARYAGEPTDDERNNDRLLEALATAPDDVRTAYYVSSIALADPTGSVRLTAEGRCFGSIVRERRGRNGFGYDPLFLPAGHQQTFGELPADVKQAISHRAHALAELRPALVELIETGGWPITI